MVPFDALIPAPAGETVAVRERGYPREVMEAGWVPEVVKLGPSRGGVGTAEDGGRAPVAPEVLRSRLF